MQTPTAQPAPAAAPAPGASVSGEAKSSVAAPSESTGLAGAGHERVHAPTPAYQNLAQQMQVFLNRTDLQQGRNNKYFLQQTLEMLSELDQHVAREEHLKAALLDTQAQIVRVKQSLVGMAAESVDAEHDALSIAQARVHLAKLLHAKLLQEFN